MLARSNNRNYLVNSSSDLSAYAEVLLTDELAHHLPDFIASEIFEEVHTSPIFYEKLMTDFRDDHKTDLALVLGIYNATNDDFWQLLYNHADPLLYAKAVISAAEVYDLEVLKNELVEELVAHGADVLSEHQEGFFQEVVIGKNSRADVFYIYDVV